MKSVSALPALLIAALTAISAASASGERQARPVLVELFTSQSCSSCVAAAEYFEELAKREDVVALGWHVDYWNSLQTRDGRWVDPYSSQAYTERQRRYNRNLRKTNSVYTPQIVIDGDAEAVGSSKSKVEKLIKSAAAAGAAAEINSALSNAKDTLHIKIDGEGEAYVVYFKPQAKTDVRGGENAGVNFVDRNVVTKVEHLGEVLRTTRFTAVRPANDEGCAILLQEAGQGRILAAQYCSGA